jgi:hypothetical protein
VTGGVRRAPLWPSLALLAAVSLSSGTARAQSWVTDVHVGVATGLEGADTGSGVGWQRARTRVVVGLDLGNDEVGYEAYGVRTFIELERSVAVGAELGYVRWLYPELSVFFGAAAVLTPETLFGGTLATTYFIPLGDKLALPIWLSFSALPLGSDRPGRGAVVWGLFGLGIRGRF